MPTSPLVPTWSRATSKAGRLTATPKKDSSRLYSFTLADWPPVQQRP